MTTSDDPGDFFAAPPFDSVAALGSLRRQLRDLRDQPGLRERVVCDGRWVCEWGGAAVLELGLAAAAIEARLARRPARPPRAPEWEPPRLLRSAADVRAFVDEVRKRMRRWEDERD